MNRPNHAAEPPITGHPRSGRRIVLALACLSVMGAGSCGAAPPEGGKNRLGAEASPYLRLHEDNPVHWYAWGKAAFAEAKKQDKPIFLSIGYSACHWCHVMNQESFTDPDIAAYLNEHFICIKVDREERPDVDTVYMSAVQILNDGHGGWPMSVFLLPDGQPFAGGTYFPPKDRVDAQGKTVMLGFPSLTERVVGFYSTRRKELEEFATRVTEATKRSGRPPLAVGSLGKEPLDRSILSDAVESTLKRFDPEYAGLGSPPNFAPKFPQPSTVLLLVDMAKDSKDRDKLLEPVIRQARAMARGGIYDQVGGGFHRYSVDRRWIVPHFEKMLYDQGQLLSLYSRLYELDPDPLHARVVDETVTFLEREMMAPDGLFHSALDADSEHEEGKFYIWTADEIRAVLGPDADWVLKMTGADADANFEGEHILVAAQTPAQAAKGLGISEDELLRKWGQAKAKLLQARAKRTRPMLDRKAITAWNGLMIVGLAEAARVFEEPRYQALATRAMDQVLGRLSRPDGKLYRHAIGGKPYGNGYADDYASTILALLAVHRLQPTAKYLEAAERLAGLLTDGFWDERHGGFFFTANDQESLYVRTKESYDGAVPSANGLAALAMVRLADRTGNPAYRAKAKETVDAFRVLLEQSPASATTMARALRLLLASAPAAAANVEPIARKDSNKPIKKIEVVPGKVRVARGKPTTFEVKIAVNKPWHINANPASPKYLRPTVVKLVGNDALRIDKVTYPKAKAIKLEGLDEKIMVYEGEVKIKVQVSATKSAKPGAGKVTLRVDYQACDDKRCLAPTKKTQSLPIVIE